MQKGVSARVDDRERAWRTISRGRRTLIVQVMVFAVLLAATLFGALTLVGTENDRGVLGMLKGGVADEIAERVVNDDTRPFGRPISLYAVVAADGAVVATGGSEGQRAEDRRLRGLSSEPGAPAGHGFSFPLHRGGWLYVEIDQQWRSGRVLGVALPISLLIVGAAAPSYILLRVLSVRLTRAAYRMRPEQVDQIVRERATLLESISEAAIGIDRHGGLLWFNPAAEDLLSLTEADLGESAEGLLASAADGGSGQGLDAPLIQIGGRVLLQWSDREFSHAAGRSRLVMFRDYSRDAAMLRELDGAQHHIDALRSRGHEFANTLHIIEGLLEMNEPTRALEFVRGGGVSGEFGMSATGIEDPDVRALVYAYRARARERGVDLVVDPAADLPDLAGVDTSFIDACLLVVGNFLSNAVESCATGDSIRLSVRIETCDSEADPELVIDVDDTGPGVPESLQDSVFDLGVTTKTGRDARGYGLAIVRGTVTRLGGSCRCRSSEHGGVQFEARIPIPELERWRFVA